MGVIFRKYCIKMRDIYFKPIYDLMKNYFYHEVVKFK